MSLPGDLAVFVSTTETALQPLSHVLEEERSRGLALAKELAQLKMRTMELEALISDFGPVWKTQPVTRYPPTTRQLKVQRYREKRALRLQRSQASRTYTGRSAAAKDRMRVGGKFASSDKEPSMA